jgi:hypothetical protein
MKRLNLLYVDDGSKSSGAHGLREERRQGGLEVGSGGFLELKSGRESHFNGFRVAFSGLGIVCRMLILFGLGGFVWYRRVLVIREVVSAVAGGDGAGPEKKAKWPRMNTDEHG